MAGEPADGGRGLTRLAAFGALLGALFLLGLLVAPHSPDRLRHDLGGLGVWGPPAVIVLGALLICVFVPGPVVAGASGLLFGIALGTVVAIISESLGATTAFLIGRTAAQKPYGTFARGRLGRWTAQIEGRGFLAIVYARIAPGAPFALVSYAAGATRIRLSEFASATAIGAAPRAFAYAALGGTLGNYSSPQALVALGVLVAMAVGGGGLLWHTRRRTRQANPLPAPRCPSQR